MQKIALLFGFFALVAAAPKKPQIDEEEHVLVLNSTNFDAAVKFYKHLLVEFYAPWCAHCKEFKPVYDSVALTLHQEESTARLAKVDVTTEGELAERFEVTGYPTFKFFVNGTAKTYLEGRKAPQLVRWLRKQVGTPFETLLTATEVQEFLAAHKQAVVGVLYEKSEPKSRIIFENLASRSDLPFALVENPENDALEALSLAPGADAFLLFKQPEEGIEHEPGSLRSQFAASSWTVDSLYQWLAQKSLPLVVEFSPETSSIIFSGAVKHHMLLFDIANREGQEQLRKEFTKAAAKFVDRVLFIAIDTAAPSNDKVLSYFGVDASELPQIRSVIMGEDGNAKYRLAEDFAQLDAAKMQKFIEDIIAKRIVPHRLHQKLPADWDKRPVKVLVSSNFEQITGDKSKHVFVEIYAPWCGHCQALAPVWEQLGEWFKHRDDVVIAKIDGTKNEPESMQFKSFPALKWFAKNSNTSVDYTGDRSIDSLKLFVESEGTIITKQYAGEFDTEIEGEDEFGIARKTEVDEKKKEKNNKDEKK